MLKSQFGVLLVLFFLVFGQEGKGQCVVSLGGNRSLCQNGLDTLKSNYSVINPTITWYVQGNSTILFTGPNFPIPSNTVGTINYVVKLVDGSCISYDTVAVTINPNPVASFTWLPNSGCGKTKINFTNNSTISSGNITNYHWDFGDGGTSNSQNPSHTFRPTPANSGSQVYTVTLTVTSNNGCKSIKSVNISLAKGPDASLGGANPSLTQYNGLPYFIQCNPTSNTYAFTFFNFSATASTNTNYIIKWGDGSPDYTNSSWTFGGAGQITHTYSVGTHFLTFIVYRGSCVDSTVYGVFLGNNPGGSISAPTTGTVGCTGDSFVFPFSNVIGNPPGTEYIIVVNDGTDTVRYTQENLPAFFTHQFDSTSCGTNPNNTFTIYYEIKNPCRTTPGSIGGIAISQKAIANFSISPKDTICQNSIVQFSNTGLNGLTVPNSGPCTIGKILWSITPATGWNIVGGGSLGTDNGFPLNADNWTSGSQILQINFSVVGNYQIKIRSGNNLCGIDDTVRTICVNPLPMASFGLSNIEGCSPLNSNSNNTSSSPFCGQNNYYWSVSYSSTNGCEPTVADYVFVNGTNANSINPQFQFNNPGIYSVGLISISPANACSSQIVTKQIIVKGMPVVTLQNIPPQICVGNSFSATNNSTCYIDAASTYQWTFPGGTPTSSSQNSPGPVIFNNSGTQNISLSVTNVCGTTTETQQITVNLLPTVSGSTTICGSATSTLTGSGSPAVTNPWVSSNTAVATISNTGVVTGVAPGSTSITYTNSNGCQITIPFTVFATPIITGSNAVCKNASINLTGNGTPAATNPWVSSNTAIATITNTGVVTGVSVGTSTITYTDINGCAKTSLITVYPIPTIGGFKSNPTACATPTGTITITGLTPNSVGYVLNYSYNGIAQTPIIFNTGAAVTTYILTNLSSGTYANISVTLNGCVSNLLDFSLNDPSAPTNPTVSTGPVICSGGTIAINVLSPIPGVIYIWSGPSGFSTTGTSISIPNAAVANGGTYQITATQNGCTSTATSVTATVNQTPNKPSVVSPITYCQNVTSVALIALPSANSTLYWYTTATGGVGSTTAPIPLTSTVGTTTYYVSQESIEGCEGSREQIDVIINPTPAINNQNETICSGEQFSITPTGSGVPPGTNYTWLSPVITPATSVSNGSSQTIGQSSISQVLYNQTTLVGTATYSVTATVGACIDTFITIITVQPNPVIDVNDSSICNGQTATLTASGANSYSWSPITGLSSGTGTTVSANPIITTQYSVIGTNSATGCRDTAVSTVTVNQLPNKPIVFDVIYCQNDIPSPLTATASSGNQLNWYNSSNVLLAGAPTPSTVSVSTFTYYVSQTNPTTQCESNKETITVTIKPTPIISLSDSSNPTNCASSTGSISLAGLVAGSSYSVQYLLNGISVSPSLIVANSSGLIVIPNLAAGTYTNISVLLNSCPSNSVGPVTLSDPNPPVTPVVSNSSPICAGNNVNLTASTTTSGLAVYSWTGPNGFTSSVQNPIINNATTSESGLYQVTVTINSCISLPGTTSVLVYPLPDAPVVISPIIYCQNQIADSLTVVIQPGNSVRWYTTATGGTGQINAPIPSSLVPGTTIYYVSQVSSQNCEGIRIAIEVIVNPTPLVSQQGSTICSGQTFTITPSSTSIPANTLYNWGLPLVTGGITGISVGVNANTISGTLTNSTDFVQTATYLVSPISGICVGDTFEVIVSVNPSPHVNFSLSNQNICSGETTASVSISSPTPSVNIPWLASVPIGISGAINNGTNSIPAQTLINNTSISLIVTYAAVAVTSGASACPGDTSIYSITVNPKPTIPSQSIEICSQDSFDFSPLNNPPVTIVPLGTLFTWTYADNPNVNGETNQSVPSDTISQTLTNNTNIPQSVIYTLIPTSGLSGNCVGSDFQLSVIVNPKPVIPTHYDTICSAGNFSVNPINGIPNSGSIVPLGTTYSWSLPNMPAGVSGAIAGLNMPNISGTLINTTFAPVNIVYSVTPISGIAGNCPGVPFDVVITVKPLSSISNNPLSQVVCTENSTQLVNWTSFTPNADYTWTVLYSGSVTGYLPANTGDTLGSMQLFNTGILIDSVVYSVTSTASACSGPATNYVIYVHPNAKASFTYPHDTACWPYPLIISNTSPNASSSTNIPNGSYEWYAISSLSTVMIGTSSIFPGYTINNPSDSIKIKMIAVSAFGCKNDSIEHIFYTKPKPSALFSISNKDSCGPLTVSFTNQTNLGDSFNYQWNFGNGQVFNSMSPSPVTYSSSPIFLDTTYYITLTAYNECDTTYYTDSVIIRANPKALFSVSSSTGCSPFPIVITNSSLGNAYAYYWDFGNGVKDTTFVNGSFNYTYTTNVVDTFDLMLIAQNQCGRDTQIINVRVAPNIIQPGISINSSELFGCILHSVTFINSTTGATSFTWDFGDNTTPVISNASQNLITHVFTTSGVFNVAIQMTNGCSDTIVYKQITVYPQPDANFTTSRLNYCVGDTVRVTNLSQAATNYTWNWGDASLGSGFEPNHVYLTPGTFTIKLKAERVNPNGAVCFDTASRSITVYTKPDTSIIINILPVNCAPFTVQANLPSVTTETVTWLVYDTSGPNYPIILNGQSLQYTFNNEGVFEIKMIVENIAGCKDSTIRLLKLFKKPVAGFSPLNSTTCSLDTLITFTNTSTANNYTPLTYKWYIDDVFQSSTGNFSYQFITAQLVILPKVYSTKLVATNSIGCNDTAMGFVKVNPTSKAQFEVNNPTACVPFLASINNSSSYATVYAWYLNGIMVSTNANPTILINEANTNYTIMLVASNAFACKPDTFVYSFVSRVMPIAAFQVNDSLGCSGQLNVVTNNTSQNATAYTWDWGDGSAVSNFINPTHLYNSIGTYQIMLTATDGICMDTVSKVLVVSVKPSVDFSVGNPRSCDTAIVQLINLTANGDYYYWVFSNGVTSTLESPIVTFPPSNSSYTVKLVAYTNAGCKDSLTKANFIRAIVTPKADFVINPAAVIVIPNYTFSFTNHTINSPLYKYEWSLGDGSFANSRHVADHLYPDTGSYPIRLIVLDTSTNCTDTIIKIARIEGNPGYLFVPNAFYPNSIQTQFRGFKPLGKGLAEYDLQIFDSWGKLVFRSTKLDASGIPMESWDGTFKGQPMPQDAYAWKIKAIFRGGKKWSGMNYNQRDGGTSGHTFGTVTLFR